VFFLRICESYTRRNFELIQGEGRGRGREKKVGETIRPFLLKTGKKFKKTVEHVHAITGKK
jgi:hypothetical protein